jgi:hypothetical protein
MCYFVPRTNWSNIESNYFMHSIIVRNLPYYTNGMITVTFVNQVTLSCTFFLFLPKNYPQKSGAIFQVDLYVFVMHTEIPNCTHKLHHVKQLAVFQDKLFAILYGGMNHFHRHWNKRMLTIMKINFYSRHARWLPLVDKWFVINDLVAVSIHFVLDLDHCLNHLLQPSCLMASSR